MRRRGWLGAVVCLALLASLAGWGWRQWRVHEEPAPAVPEIALSAEVDPKLAEAVEAMRRAVLLQPRSAAAWGRLGKLLLANGFPAPAGVCLHEAERLEPSEPRWPYLQAILLLSHERDAALPYLKRAVALCDERDPDKTTPRLLLAEVYLERGELEEAESQCQRVLERDPENPRAHFSLGMIALARNHLQDSIRHLTRSATSPLARQKAYRQLAAVYLRQGNKAMAETLSREAQQAPPDLPWVDPYSNDYQHLAMGRQQQLLDAEQLEREGRLAEEEKVLRAVAIEYPDDRSYVALGVAMTKSGRYQAAEEVLRHALQQAPDKINAHYALSVALFQQAEQLSEAGKRDAATAKFRAAAASARRTVQLKSDHALAHLMLGRSLDKLGQKDKAIDALRMAARCRPELASLHLYLGEALAADGQNAEARIHLQHAVDLSPADDVRPRQALARLREK
jgi:tetratricopeptide (TPR) repeat protein